VFTSLRDGSSLFHRTADKQTSEVLKTSEVSPGADGASLAPARK
jgi:hypothetical protein